MLKLKMKITAQELLLKIKVNRLTQHATAW